MLWDMDYRLKSFVHTAGSVARKKVKWTAAASATFQKPPIHLQQIWHGKVFNPNYLKGKNNLFKL